MLKKKIGFRGIIWIPPFHSENSKGYVLLMIFTAKYLKIKLSFTLPDLSKALQAAWNMDFQPRRQSLDSSPSIKPSKTYVASWVLWCLARVLCCFVWFPACFFVFRCLFFKISRSNEMEGSINAMMMKQDLVGKLSTAQCILLWLPSSKSAWRTASSNYIRQGKSKMSSSNSPRSSKQQNITKSCQLLLFNIQTAPKSRSMHPTACSSSTTTKKPWSCNHPAGGLPVGDQMKPIRPSEFHRQGWQHIGQINHTNTCLQTSFLEARAKEKTTFGWLVDLGDGESGPWIASILKNRI